VNHSVLADARIGYAGMNSRSQLNSGHISGKALLRLLIRFAWMGSAAMTTQRYRDWLQHVIAGEFPSLAFAGRWLTIL